MMCTESGQRPSAELAGIPQATISAIENGPVNLGVERAKTFARAQLPSFGNCFRHLEISL